MSVPALRQPKFVTTDPENKKISPETDSQFVIVTLRSNVKLVLPSDAYNGILKVEEIYKCVFCDTEMELNNNYKESHKSSEVHTQTMNALPYVAEYAENLMRRLNKENMYCPICNVIVTSPFLQRHITSKVHVNELHKAIARVSAYTTDDNNN